MKSGIAMLSPVSVLVREIPLFMSIFRLYDSALISSSNTIVDIPSES